MYSEINLCFFKKNSDNLRIKSKYLLAPWSRVLLEQLTLLQLVKKFPAFHGTPRFITAFTSVRHLSLSWVSPIQFIYPHPTSWRSVLILSTHVYVHFLTPQCRVLLEKLTGLQPVKKFPAFHGTRRFITALTSVRHLSLSWASPIQSIYPHPTSLEIHLNIIHPSTPRSSCIKVAKNLLRSCTSEPKPLHENLHY